VYPNPKSRSAPILHDREELVAEKLSPDRGEVPAHRVKPPTSQAERRELVDRRRVELVLASYIRQLHLPHRAHPRPSLVADQLGHLTRQDVSVSNVPLGAQLRTVCSQLLQLVD